MSAETEVEIEKLWLAIKELQEKQNEILTKLGIEWKKKRII